MATDYLIRPTFLPRTPDATRSTVVVGVGSINNDGTTCTVTVTVRDRIGRLVPRATVVLESTGTGNTLTQPVAVTDSNGVATGTFASSVAEAKTISATANGTAITDTAVVTVEVAEEPSGDYPNEPVGLTPIAQFDGTVRESGGSAMDISWLGPWNTDAAAPAGNLAVVADATNPNGSGSALRFVWNQAYNPRCADAAGSFPSELSTLYIMARVFYEDDAWASFGHKFFYIGLPSVAGSSDLYLTRELDGRMYLTVQAGGLGVVIDTSDPAPVGASVSPLATLGQWYNIELLMEAESSVGAGDGKASLWVNGVLVAGPVTTIAYGGNFGGLEWYADANTVTSESAYRLGELYIAGSV